MVKRIIDREIMDIVNKYVEVILANYKVKAIILFGSYAKGTNHEDSDIQLRSFSHFYASSHQESMAGELRSDGA